MAKRTLNLNQARKRREKSEKDRAAEKNRRWHGLSRSERASLDDERQRNERALANKRLERDKPDGERDP